MPLARNMLGCRAWYLWYLVCARAHTAQRQFSLIVLHLVFECVSLSVCLCPHKPYVAVSVGAWWQWSRDEIERKKMQKGTWNEKRKANRNEISNDAFQSPTVTLMLFLLFWCLWSRIWSSTVHGLYSFFLFSDFLILNSIIVYIICRMFFFCSNHNWNWFHYQCWK